MFLLGDGTKTAFIFGDFLCLPVGLNGENPVTFGEISIDSPVNYINM